MKTKVLLFLFAFSFIAQLLLAQKTGLFFHTITFRFPQLADINLVSNSKNTTKIKKRNNNVLEFGKSNLWLNYHSIISTSIEPSKNIWAQLTKGSLDPKLTLSIIASKDLGNGNGVIGKPIKTPIILSRTIARKIIDDIGIAHTGEGVNQGHQLTYLITSEKRLNNLNNISNNSLTITYTLFDD